MKEVVNVSDVCLKYQSKNGEIEALSHVSFSINSGEYMSVVGPSGCGKSTLLSIIAGLLKPTSGQVFVENQIVEKPSPALGYMFQKDQLFSWRTVYQNVLLGLEIQRQKTPDNIAYVDKLLKEYGLYEFKDKFPDQLSGGMRQRAALIRTLACRPEILLLDEPFSSLDYQTRLAVADDIYQIIKNEKKTAIMVTHDISESISVSDKVVILSGRPARVKEVLDITFEEPARTPLTCRKYPEFQKYFNHIWKELDIHVS